MLQRRDYDLEILKIVEVNGCIAFVVKRCARGPFVPILRCNLSLELRLCGNSSEACFVLSTT